MTWFNNLIWRFTTASVFSLAARRKARNWNSRWWYIVVFAINSTLPRAFCWNVVILPGTGRNIVPDVRLPIVFWPRNFVHVILLWGTRCTSAWCTVKVIAQITHVARETVTIYSRGRNLVVIALPWMVVFGWMAERILWNQRVRKNWGTSRSGA